MGELKFSYTFSAWTKAGTEVIVTMGALLERTVQSDAWDNDGLSARVVSQVRDVVRVVSDGRTPEDTVLAVWDALRSAELELSCVRVSLQFGQVRVEVSL